LLARTVSAAVTLSSSANTVRLSSRCSGTASMTNPGAVHGLLEARAGVHSALGRLAEPEDLPNGLRVLGDVVACGRELAFDDVEDADVAAAAGEHRREVAPERPGGDDGEGSSLDAGTQVCRSWSVSFYAALAAERSGIAVSAAPLSPSISRASWGEAISRDSSARIRRIFATWSALDFASSPLAR